MSTWVIVNIGDFINIRFESTMQAFIEKIPEESSTIKVDDQGNKDLKADIRKEFLDRLVAQFRVNGFFTKNDLSPGNHTLRQN
jgi:hypothetical protein